MVHGTCRPREVEDQIWLVSFYYDLGYFDHEERRKAVINCKPWLRNGPDLTGAATRNRTLNLHHYK